jgi:hypothetical protein
MGLTTVHLATHPRSNPANPLEDLSRTRPIQPFPTKQFLHATPHFVPYRPHLGNSQTLRVAQRPVLSPKSRNIRTVFSAAHGHKQARIACQTLRQQLWLGVGKIDSKLLHHFQYFSVHTRAGRRSRRNSPSPTPIDQMVEKSCRHLGTPGVVYTRKNKSPHLAPALSVWSSRSASALPVWLHPRCQAGCRL